MAGTELVVPALALTPEAEILIPREVLVVLRRTPIEVSSKTSLQGSARTAHGGTSYLASIPRIFAQFV